MRARTFFFTIVTTQRTSTALIAINYIILSFYYDELLRDFRLIVNQQQAEFEHVIVEL